MPVRAQLMGISVTPIREKLVGRLADLRWIAAKSDFSHANGERLLGRHSRELREMRKAGWLIYTGDTITLAPKAQAFFNVLR
jgi:hypothetical protein